MTTTTASMGYQAKLGTVAESTYGVTPAGGDITAINQAFIFKHESIHKRGVIIERHGIRGTREHVADDTRLGPYSVVGRLVLEPTPQDLAIWLPRILGSAASGTNYALAETLPSFSLGVDRVAKRFLYGGCKISRATFSGSQGGLMQLALDIVAQSESVEATAFPNLTPSMTHPFIFQEMSLTLAGAAREAKEFELTIDNALVTDRFMNATTIVDLPEGDRTVVLRTSHGYTAANTDLYAQALVGASGALALTNAVDGYALTFNFGTLQVPDRSPTVESREEIMLVLSMVARKTGSTPSVSATLDSTPG